MSDVPMSSNMRAALTGIGAAVLIIREMSDDPAARLRLVRQFAAGMAAVVNDPEWGAVGIAHRNPGFPARPSPIRGRVRS